MTIIKERIVIKEEATNKITDIGYKFIKDDESIHKIYLSPEDKEKAVNGNLTEDEQKQICIDKFNSQNVIVETTELNETI